MVDLVDNRCPSDWKGRAMRHTVVRAQLLSGSINDRYVSACRHTNMWLQVTPDTCLEAQTTAEVKSGLHAGYLNVKDRLGSKQLSLSMIHTRPAVDNDPVTQL